MKQFILLLAIATIGLSFTPTNGDEGKKPKKKAKKERIVYKLKKNLFDGWQMQDVQDEKKFSQPMLALGIEYAISLTNPPSATAKVSTLSTSNTTKINVFISRKDEQSKMVNYIKGKAQENNLQYRFLFSRQYLLTFVWPKQQNSSKDITYRAKLFKQLDWYFEMY